MSEPDDTREAPTQSPPGLVFGAVAIGGLGIGFGIAATVLMLKSQESAAAPSATVSQRLPAPEPAPRQGPWTEELHAEVCPAPCCGGAACRVGSESPGKPCASGLSCIPGACGERFAGDEALALHLSGVIERGSSGEAIDACKSRRDLWLCVKREDESSWQCLSQREACSNQSRSPAGVELSAAELTRKGLLFEVREGGPDGEVLARRSDAIAKSGLQRRGLCGGYRGDFDAGPVSAFTFFLDVPGGADAPAPVRVAHKDAGTEDAPAPEASAEAALPVAPAASAAP